MQIKINGDLFHEIYNKAKKEPGENMGNEMNFHEVFDKARIPDSNSDEVFKNITDQVYSRGAVDPDNLISTLDKMIHSGMSKTEITEFLYYYISDVTHGTKEAIDTTIYVVKALKQDAVISSQYALEILEITINKLKHIHENPITLGILSFLKEFALTTISNI